VAGAGVAVTPDGRPDTLWELVAYVTGAAGMALAGLLGGRRMRRRDVEDAKCEADAKVAPLQRQVDAQHASVKKDLEVLRITAQAAEVRDERVMGRMDALCASVDRLTQAANNLLNEMRAASRARNGGR